MAVVVTGGYGHCGSWVVRKLVDHGKDVIIFNRSRRRLDYVEEVKERVRYFKGDVLDMPSIFRMFREYDEEIEGIVHIAGLAGSPYFATNPHHHININTMGTVNFLEAARIFGKKKFVYISSGSVYGERSNVPKESDPVSPSDLYGSVKAGTELIGLQYANEFDIDFRSARIYFAYGPGRMPSELYPLYQAVFGNLESKMDIKLETGEDQELDFTYVEDVAEGILSIYNADSVNERVFNISSGRFYKLHDIIKLVGKNAAQPFEINLGPGKIVPRGPSLDITRIHEELGFKPIYSLEEGSRRYSEWIQKNKAR